jgi:hypothetical protein
VAAYTGERRRGIKIKMANVVVIRVTGRGKAKVTKRRDIRTKESKRRGYVTQNKKVRAQ